MSILAGSCAFVAGMAVAATGNPAWAAVLSPVVAFAFMLTRRSRATVALVVAVVALSGATGALRYEGSLPAADETLLSSLNDGERVELQATVAEEPEQGGRYAQVLLDKIRIVDVAGTTPLEGRLLVTTADPRPFHYGDAVHFSGFLETPEPIDDFDYAAYLALKGVYSTALNPDLQVLPSESRGSIRGCLLAANTALGERLAAVLPEPEASLAQSLLLGRRGALPASVADAFTTTGTAHLLAISGLHLGILLAAVLGLLLAVLGRRHYLYVWLGLATLWAYALFTGMRPPVVRAAIMGSTFLLAELAGRQRHAPTALALAAAVMVAIEPQLLWRTSFQLSVLAMGGLILLFPPLRAMLNRLNTLVGSKLRLPWSDDGVATDIVAATLAATIAIWPACAGTFGRLSVVGVPVSLLTLPVLPFALGSASVAAVAALISTTPAAPFAWVAWLFLSCIAGIVQAFASLEWASVEVGAAAPWFAAGYYAVLCATPLWWRRIRATEEETRPKPHNESDTEAPGWLRHALPPLLLAATLTWVAVATAPDGRLHVIFMDVGQGDCVLVQSPTGRTALIDGGPDGRDTCVLIDSHRPFWDRSIDVVVATHGHADHVGGLLSIIERYRTGLVLDSCVAGDSLVSEEWQRRMTAHDPAPCCATAGFGLSLGDGTQMDILHPPVVPLANTSDDLDNNGVVIRVTYGEVSFLLSADIRAEAESLLVHRHSSQLDSQVLKVPHHGSHTSSTTPFIVAVGATVAVVSAGEDNAYGHPHDEVLERFGGLGVEVLTTPERGTIEFVTDGHDLWLRTEKAATPETSR